MRAGVTALAVAGAAAVLIGGAAFVGAPESVTQEHPGNEQPVVRTSLVCPYVGGEAAGSSEIGVLALPEVATAETEEDQVPATVRALAIPPPPDPDATEEPSPPEPVDAEPIMSVTERGIPTISEVTTDAGTSFVVEGSDALAPGLAAEQSMLAQATDIRGLSTTPCTAASREHWFVGGSGEVGRRGRLVLANPTDVAAVVDVALWDEAGEVEAPATQDIGVPARSQRVLLLDALAPESARVGVQVTTSQGRVSAALEVRESAEITPQGVTFVPAAATPSTSVVVPGVPGHGQRVLRILAPGDTDAIVSMRLFGAEGPFSPVDQDVLTVPSGSVLEVPLDAAGTAPVAVALDSDEPITAAARVVETPADGGQIDLAYSSATPPLAGPAAAVLGRTTGGFTSTLFVSGVTDTAARVNVQTIAADGSVAAEQDVDVPAGATVPVPLAAPAGETYASVVVVPESPGSVVVAREILAADADGALFDLMPLVSSAITVEVPDVVGELPSVPGPEESAG